MSEQLTTSKGMHILYEQLYEHSCRLIFTACKAEIYHFPYSLGRHVEDHTYDNDRKSKNEKQ